MKNQPERLNSGRHQSFASAGQQNIFPSGETKTNEEQRKKQGRELRTTTLTRKRFDRTEHDGSDHLL